MIVLSPNDQVVPGEAWGGCVQPWIVEMVSDAGWRRRVGAEMTELVSCPNWHGRAAATTFFSHPDQKIFWVDIIIIKCMLEACHTVKNAGKTGGAGWTIR